MPSKLDIYFVNFLPLEISDFPCNARIVVMGTNEKLGVNIHVDQLMDAIASNCGNLERLELR